MHKKFAHIVGGVVENTILADAAFAAAHPLDWIECPDEFGIGHLYDSATGVFSLPAVPATPPIILPWTKKEFLLKFTPAEYAAVVAATKVNATLDYYWTLFMLADNVLKTDPVTIGGVQALEANGILASGRAQEILA